MLSRKFLAGISLLAFAAGAANAQEANINDERVRGNGTNESNCTPEGTPGNNGNLCTVRIDGSDGDGVSGAEENFVDSAFIGDDNTTTVSIFGDGNSATIAIFDVGDGGGITDDDDADLNVSTITIGTKTGGHDDGTDGSGVDSDLNTASSVQVGDSNSSLIVVGSTGSSNQNRSGNVQGGDANSATITQNDDFNSAYNEQFSDNDGSIGATNIATITQSSDTNSASNFQDNRGVSATSTGSNIATITQTGSGQSVVLVNNYAMNEQYAESFDSDGALTRDNTADISQNGTFNTAENYQYGEGNVADVDQGVEGNGGFSNSSSVSQYGQDNFADVTQTGANNSSIVVQGYYFSTTTTTVASDNTATVIMDGENMSSYVSQNRTTVGGGNFARVNLGNTGSQIDDTFDGNSSTLVQEGNDNIARIILRDGEGMGDQDIGLPDQNAPNTSTVFQTGDANEVVVSISTTNPALDPDMNSSYVSQTGEDNYADVTISFGTEDPDPEIGSPTFGRQGGNTSSITQTGEGNTAVVTIAQKAGQQFFGLGNSVTITQTESSAADLENDQTRGFNPETNRVEGDQPDNLQNNADEMDGRLAYYEFGTETADRANGNAYGARGHQAETFNFGRFDTLNITQGDDLATGDPADSDSTATGRVYTGGEYARARANVSQSGYLGLVDITQNGDNYADVVQGRAPQDGIDDFEGQSSITLVQTDAGDTPEEVDESTPGGCNESGCVPGEDGVSITFANGRQYNQALLTQYGDFNSQTVTQDTRDGYVDTFQRGGTSRNLIEVEQGTGSTNESAGLATTDGPYENSPIGTTTAVGTDSQRLTAFIEQAGDNNAAQVQQDGLDNVASVMQLGDGVVRTGTDFAGFGSTNGNTVIVRQQGTDNSATANQHEGVTASDPSDSPASGRTAAQNAALGEPAVDDDFYFSGVGGRSPEIDIFQSGEGNSAEVDQFGRGQYAQIFQGPVGGTGAEGNDNVADIWQGPDATNATAIIRQSGSRNTFYIVQNEPGSYLQVEQTGNDNNILGNNFIGRVQPGDSFGFTPQPTPPTP